MIAWLMGLKAISVEALQQQLGDAQVTALDLNTRGSWVKARVPGAIHLDPGQYSEQDLPADKKTQLVFYCSNPMCRKAPTAARRATQMGYANVRVLSAGISGWLAAGKPVESGE